MKTRSSNAVMIASVAVVAGILSLAVAPAVFAQPAPVETAAAASSEVAPGTSNCLTFDEMIAQAEAEANDPNRTFNVLGGTGEFAESTKGHMGPLATKLHNESIARLEQQKAEAIAKGEDCIGYR